jgi:hypothetical protein
MDPNNVLCFAADVLTDWRLSHSQLISPVALLITSRHGPHQKHLSYVAVQLPFSGPHEKHLFFVDAFGSLPSNGSSRGAVCSYIHVDYSGEFECHIKTKQE